MRNSLYLFIFLLTMGVQCAAQEIASNVARIKQTNDFEISGDGKNKAWESANWVTMLPSEKGEPRETRFKALYSATGMYFLFYNRDELLSATMTADFEKLWLEDVNELFIWTDTTETIYFEYQISPLNYELAILVPNFDGKFLGWRPWQYEGERKTKHLTVIEGGEKKPGSKVYGWYAEFFIPYALLTPLRNVPPTKGSVWRANMYRIDYDNKKTSRWQWRKTETNFHQYTRFGALIFD